MVNPKSERKTASRIPDDYEHIADPEDGFIDEASIDSFPASDPPSFWAR